MLYSLYHEILHEKRANGKELGIPLSEFYPGTPPANQDCRINQLSFNIEPYGKNV